MKRRFVIAVESLDTDQEKSLREFLADHGLWWHWIGNVWLLVTHDEETSAVKIRDYILDLDRYARVVVFEAPEDTDWAASGNRNKAGKRIYDWLKATWDGE